MGMVEACPICGSTEREERFSNPTSGSESGVSADAFRPSSEGYGTSVGRIVRCRRCTHSYVADLPPDDAVENAYGDAEDPVSLREEAGQVETARRALAEIERVVPRGRVLDVGCWTGSFLLAAKERGWETIGIEPSRWAAARAQERGLDIRRGTLTDQPLPPGTVDLVVLCDVLEHLADPHDALRTVSGLLTERGGLFITVPDAGSRLARVLGRRWWSVLPMHLQHFTRRSMRELLERNGFAVRSEGTHPKVFTARYYAERLGGYTPTLERMAVGAVRMVGLSDRLVAPDFRDRLAVIATRATR